MTLGEVKKKALAMVEELDTSNRYLTGDEDIQKKINYIVNQVQNEVARIKKIPEKAVVEITSDNLIYDLNELELFYQLQLFRGIEGEAIGTKIYLKEPGTLEIYYYRYPAQIDDESDDEDDLDVSIDVADIMPYGIAADMLKSDVSNNYGQIYAQRYAELLRELDPRYTLGSIYIETMEG